MIGLSLDHLARREYAYTPRGELAKVRDANGEVTYRFDSLGRILDAIRQHAWGAAYPGDLTGPEQRTLVTVNHVGSRPSVMRFADSHTALVRYDPTFRQIGMDWRRLSDGTVLAGERVLYGSRGQVSVHQLGGRTRALDYDSLLRLVGSRDFTNMGLADVAGLAPAPSAAALSGAPSQTAVDALVGSIQATLDGQVVERAIEYTLDENGNRLGTLETSAGATAQVDYSPTRHDQYQTVGGAGQIYDRVGNLLTDGPYRYAYDTAHRLTRIVTPVGEIRIARDQIGRINRLSRPSLEREIVHAGWRIIEWRQSGVLQGQLVPLLRPNQYAHVAVGEKSSLPSSMSYPLARSYHPAHGRFLQRDPLGFIDGLNRYTFAQNAPTTMTDYFGFKAAEIDWGIAGLGLGMTVFSAGALMAMFYVHRLASTLTPQGRAATITGVLLSYVLGKALSDSLVKNVTDAQKSGASVPGGVALSVADAVLPIRSSYEAITGKSFYPTPDRTYLTTEERSMAVGHALGGSLLAGLVPALIGSGRSRPPVEPPPSVVRVADQGNWEATLVGYGSDLPVFMATGEGKPPANFSFGVAAGFDRLFLALHGVRAATAAGVERGAWAVEISSFLTNKLGLRPPRSSGGRLPTLGETSEASVMSPELLAMYTVYYLKFRGSFIDLQACGAGYYSSLLDQSFVEAYAKILAQFLGRPITVRGPTAILSVDPMTGATSVNLSEVGPSLPAGEAFTTVTAP